LSAALSKRLWVTFGRILGGLMLHFGIELAAN
jgi:hypothetical protein